MREILSEASRLIRNRHFALAVLIMLIAFSGYAACDWVLMYDWDVAYRSSSLQQTLGGIYFGRSNAGCTALRRPDGWSGTG